jgi:hypothetical protein
MWTVRPTGIPLLLILVAALTGCPMSQYPIGSRADAVSEPRLVGTWEAATDAGDADWRRLHVFANTDATAFEIVAIDDGGWAVLQGYVTEHEERRYVDLTLRDASETLLEEIGDDREAFPFWFVAIRFDGEDVLEVAVLADAIRDLIDDGTLTGRASSGDGVTLMTPSSAIAAEMATKRDVDLFADALRYRRVTATD